MKNLKEAIAKAKKNEAIDIQVTFANGNVLKTSINTDLEGAKRYYLGKVFNLGNGENDLMTKAIKVEMI